MIRTTTVRQIFLIPGNWDLGYFHLFWNPMEGLIDICQKHYRLKNGYEMIGYPFVPPTPFRPKDFEKMDDPESPWPPQKNPSYIRSSDQNGSAHPHRPHVYLRQRETIQEDLDHLSRPKDPRKTIYVMHSPPFKTKLDRIMGGRFTGSRSISRFIEKTQPLLTLHGHIHEAPEISGSCLDRIGKNPVRQSGTVYSFGKSSSRLHAITFELENPEETLQHTLLPEVKSSDLRVMS